MSQTEYKLNIFDVLSQIDKKNIHFYENLPDDKKKAFSPFLAFRWLYGTPHDLQVVLLNQCLNPSYLTHCCKHPDLVYKLFTVTSVKAKTAYKWRPKNQETGFPLALDTIAKYYDISKRIAKLHLPTFSAEDIMNMGDYIGLQGDEMKKLKTELKKL